MLCKFQELVGSPRLT